MDALKVTAVESSPALARELWTLPPTGGAGAAGDASPAQPIPQPSPRRLRIPSVRPWLDVTVLREAVHERIGHPVAESHRPHLESALEWLVCSQDAGGDGGFARGYSLAYHPFFRSRGWQPPYPETTGYLIPTLYLAGDLLQRPDLHARAERAARWEVSHQMESGAVRGGVVTTRASTPAVFNTGQVLFGWLAAYERSHDATFRESCTRAADFLVEHMDADGVWRRGNSVFSRADSTLYNARTAWALAEAGTRLQDERYTAAARSALRAVARRQTADGWFPDCCLNDPARPLLHTIAYTIRGLVEGGRVLGDESLIQTGARAAAALARTIDRFGRMPGRFHPDWSPAADWSCLTGQAQLANCWMRLSIITGDLAWLGPVPRVLAFLKCTQNRMTGHAGLRGGIKGSWPLSGHYAPFEVLNWATKFFVDALIRHELLTTSDPQHLLRKGSLA